MARVLVIEDETDLRELLEYNLKGAGYEVLVGLRRAPPAWPWPASAAPTWCCSTSCCPTLRASTSAAC